MRPAIYADATLRRFSVNVPVLSVHITVVLPRTSEAYRPRERAFKAVFQNKDYVRARLIVLKSYRDPVAHSRGDITSREKGEVVGAIHWMRKMIRAQSSIEDFARGAGGSISFD
jgi:hypothetical protein